MNVMSPPQCPLTLALSSEGRGDLSSKFKDKNSSRRLPVWAKLQFKNKNCSPVSFKHPPFWILNCSFALRPPPKAGCRRTFCLLNSTSLHFPLFYHSLTLVPIFSPKRILFRFPSFCKLNTIIGSLFSMHSEMAVRSITFNLRFNTSR